MATAQGHESWHGKLDHCLGLTQISCPLSVVSFVWSAVLGRLPILDHISETRLRDTRSNQNQDDAVTAPTQPKRTDDSTSIPEQQPKDR